MRWIDGFRVDGKVSAEKREDILEHSKKSQHSTVANYQLLATGADEAEQEMVVMVDPPFGHCLA